MVTPLTLAAHCRYNETKSALVARAKLRVARRQRGAAPHHKFPERITRDLHCLPDCKRKRREIMRKAKLLGAALLSAGMLLAPSAQAAGGGVRVGTLSCNVAPGWGHVVASSRQMNCTYRPFRRGAEHYTGTLSRYGVDLGHTRGGTLVWAVVAPTSNVGRTALEGSYGGLTAGATVGVGGDANLLIGGFDRSITLQPLSVQGNSGLALQAGVGYMRLRAA
jgi:hypothetical protein